ncbi:MAG: hypothetical protein ABSG13_00670 [Bryobacteraceae bacterium]|jgi:hypothetical protein
MKLFCAFTLLAAAALASVNPQLHEVKRVYILAMGSGMDQYLASQLTKAGLFEVVTDPKKADAIVTDNVGEAFQKKVDDLYPAPPPPPGATKPAADSDTSLDVGDSNVSDAKAAKKDGLAGLDFGGGAPRSGSLGRGKGNFFVVDRNSRIVLWSVYERPKNSTPGELTKTAGRVVKHLKEDLTDKKPAE